MLPAAQAPKSSLKDLSWLAGCWEANLKGSEINEQWMEPSGGVMLGMGRTKGPLPFAANLTSEFTVIPVDGNQTTLRVVQEGFSCDSAADEFYAGCEVGWRDTFAGIKRYLESGAAARP